MTGREDTDSEGQKGRAEGERAVTVASKILVGRAVDADIADDRDVKILQRRLQQSRDAQRLAEQQVRDLVLANERLKRRVAELESRP